MRANLRHFDKGLTNNQRFYGSPAGVLCRDGVICRELLKMAVP
jgi:hypothetical protein